MPQINRIRVNNVKYNFGTQYYDDFMMRFHCRNTIYDLANGGGKSLLMLLLLQNVIPNCTLDEKQPIEKLFRQGSGNTVIHSLIEWKLDAKNSDGYKYMTTGFCARKAKDTGSEQSLTEDMEAEKAMQPRDNASVEYFNYCLFYREFGDNDIKNLPLAKDGERITYNGLKNYLRELEKNDFHVSVKIFERKGEYQSFISRYGLYESEWEIIRGINKTEGHVRTYFETNYKTSRKVVEDLLIEEIIQKSFHNKLAVGNDEGLMAQTLLDIKDTLVRLSKKNAQISNYDRQIQVLDSFAEYVSGYAVLYEEKARLQQQLFEMLLMCKKQLAGYRQQEETQQQAIAGLRAESENQQRLIQTAEVLREQASLKSMEELIAVKEAKRNKDKEREAMLKNQLDLMEASGEYREYCGYERLFCELQTAIAGRAQSDEELAGELSSLAAVIKPLYEEKEQVLSAEIAALKQRQADNEVACIEAEETYKKLVEQQAAAAGFLEYTKSEIADREERAVGLMEKAGLLVMENAKEELENCSTVQEAAKQQMQHAQQTLEEIRGMLLEKKEAAASCKAAQEALGRQCAEAEKDRQRREEAQEKLEQLKAVYAESDTQRAGQVILENYRKMETECSRLQQECSQLEQFAANTKQGVYASPSYQRDKVGEYLRGRYGADVKDGREWLETLDTVKKERVLQAVPYAEYAFVIENDFTRIREDKVLADFGRSEYVIPVLAAAAADAVFDDTWQEYAVFAKKDTSFLKDAAQREREVKLAEEELETAKARLAKLSDRKDIVWSDFLLMQRLTEDADSEKMQRQETLFARREQLEKEAVACQEAIAELTQQENRVAEEIGQAKQQLEEEQERSGYLKEVAELSDILRVAYQEKQEFAKQAAQAEEAQLAVQAEKRAAQEAVRTAAEQIKNAQETLAAMRKTWQESYQTYDIGAAPIKAELLQTTVSEKTSSDRADIKALESRFMGLKMALDEKKCRYGRQRGIVKAVPHGDGKM